jgi:hypothetical protein
MEKMLYARNVRIEFVEQNCALCSKFFDGYPTARNLRILCHGKVCFKLLLFIVMREIGRNLDSEDLTVPQAREISVNHERGPKQRPGALSPELQLAFHLDLCEASKRILDARLRKEDAARILSHVSKGDMETGLFKLTETTNQIAAGSLPMHKHWNCLGYVFSHSFFNLSCRILFL